MLLESHKAAHGSVLFADGLNYAIQCIFYTNSHIFKAALGYKFLVTGTLKYHKLILKLLFYMSRNLT